MAVFGIQNQSRWITGGVLAGLAFGSALPRAFGESAQVLPAGRSRLSFAFAQSGQISSTYSSDGSTRGITDPYNLKLDATSLSNISGDVREAYQLLDGMAVYYDASKANDPATRGISLTNTGVKLADQFRKGNLDVQAEAQQTQYGIQYGYGVTDQVSVAFVLPIKKTKVRTRYGISGQSNIGYLASITQGFASTAELQKLYDGLAYLDAADTETLQRILGEAGYQRFGDTETTGIGDIVFAGRYNYLKTRRQEWLNSGQLSVTAPTGKLKDPSTLTGVDNGQGAWDVGLAHITNYTPPIMKSRWMFSHGLHYTHRLPDSRMYRVKQPGEFVPTYKGDEELDMQLGDKIWTNLGAKYSFTKTFSMEANYEWYWKRKDVYRGNRPIDYTYLSDETKIYLETLNIGGSVSTIDAFLNKRFPLPADVNFNYFHPVRGKNTLVAPYGMVEIALYF